MLALSSGAPIEDDFAIKSTVDPCVFHRQRRAELAASSSGEAARWLHEYVSELLGTIAKAIDWRSESFQQRTIEIGQGCVVIVDNVPSRVEAAARAACNYDR